MKTRLPIELPGADRSKHSPVGIGLRAAHIDALLGTASTLSWVEIHSENWMTDSGPIAERLAEIRRGLDISLHGVGMSLGSTGDIDHVHLQRLRRLVERSNPILVSEHLSWGSIGNCHSNDLLPMPYATNSIRLLGDKIDHVQQVLGRELLVENVSSYCTFSASTMPEWEFVREVVERADCGLLLDLNNLYVNARNHAFDPDDYLAAMPWGRIKEVHLAGFDEDKSVLIDTHGRHVQQPVWTLFASCLGRLRADTRVLVEWDTDLPTLDVLLGEAAKADRLLAAHEACHA